MTGSFMPVCKEDCRERGIEQLDFVYVIGDAYVDHSSFGPAIIGRLLESHGYTVGIIAQPDWKNPESIQVFGEPRLAFLVSAGNMDSMVNHYTVSKKHRQKDAYSPGGQMGLRPDRAVIVYGNLIRRTYKHTPVILGGIEASLRRLGHYDYWSDQVKRSVLLDSGALLSGIGANKNAKRAAMVHLYFNVIGTITFMVIFYTLNAFVHFDFLADPANEAGIAVVHSCFNIFATLLLLPFSRVLERLACLTIRDSKTEEEPEEYKLLDERFLDKPAFAMEQSFHVAAAMAEESKKTLFTALELLTDFSEEKAQKVSDLETVVDHYEDQLGSYLVKLSRKNLNSHDSHTLSIVLHCIGDFERISDHAINIMEAAVEMNKKQLAFSKKAEGELKVFCDAIRDIVNSSYDVFINQDLRKAQMIEPLEEVIDELNQELKKRHIRRLRNGKCTIELGFILSDITTSLERVADHCSNISVCVTQVREDTYDTHSYLDSVKNEDSGVYRGLVLQAQEKYMLP